MGSLRIARTHDLDEALERIRVEMKLITAEFAQRSLFVHAGVVGWKGRAIVIPGPTESGKSTLVAELVRLGAKYYSDEYALVTARGNVLPFAQPLELRDESGVQQSIDLGSRQTAAGKSLRPGLVVVTKYGPRAAWRPKSLSGGEAVLALLENTVAARRRPADALRYLSRLTARAVCVKSPRGEAAAVARQILALAEVSWQK